jgi:hypothetical protein
MDDMGKVIREKVAGYRELEELQAAERAKETFLDRARALTTILRQSVFEKATDSEEAVVRERWVRLKSAYERRGT